MYNNEINNIELFMLAEFIDILDALDKFSSIDDLKIDLKIKKRIYSDYINKYSNNFIKISLNNEEIAKKIENCKEIYSGDIKYKLKIKEFKKMYKKLNSKLDSSEIQKLDEIIKIIGELYDFKARFAYKIGLVDGIKLKKTN